MGSKKIGNLDKFIVGINRISEAGFPEKIWPVIFVRDCNLRCPYCLNVGIVCPSDVVKSIPFEEIESQLSGWGEDGVLISGGEPCMPREGFNLSLLVRKLSRKFKVGISTNGTYPHVLRDLMFKQNLSYVALDCKFFASTKQEAESKSAILGSAKSIWQKMTSSLSSLHDWHDVFPGASSEVRVTLYPKIIGESDIAGISTMVHPKSHLVLQLYRSSKGFSNQNPINSYNEATVLELHEIAKQNCAAKVSIRWP